jgi:hypothetical protein
VWRKFHLLTPFHLLVVVSLSASVLATPVALHAVSHETTNIMRDLLWPHQLAPYIGFSATFLAVIPIFLGYYHLGRVGTVLGLLLSGAIWYAAILAAAYVFLSRSVQTGVVAYGMFCLLLYSLLFWCNLKMADARAVKEAQRKMRLVPPIAD